MVLPILNVNGYKISEPTIFGCMSDSELGALFTGYGYQVRVVGNDLGLIDADMLDAMMWAVQRIRENQREARARSADAAPATLMQWPMIVLRTPKGWTGVKALHGKPVEGTFRSHQVPLPEAKTDAEELRLLEEWLRSYHVEELVSETGQIDAGILGTLPVEDMRMGGNPLSYANYRPLDLPQWKETASEAGSEQSAMKQVGKYLKGVIEKNPRTFRIFSPDGVPRILSKNTYRYILRARQQQVGSGV